MQKRSHQEIIMRRDMNVALWQFSISAFIDNLDAGWLSHKLAAIQCHMKQKSVFQWKIHFSFQKKYWDSNYPSKDEYILLFCDAVFFLSSNEVQWSESSPRDIFRSIAIKIFAFSSELRDTGDCPTSNLTVCEDCNLPSRLLQLCPCRQSILSIRSRFSLERRNRDEKNAISRVLSETHVLN